MPQICPRVPWDTHCSWWLSNAHAYLSVFLSFRTLAEVPISQRQTLWEDKSKDPRRPLNPWTSSRSHSLPSNSSNRMHAELHLAFRSWSFPSNKLLRTSHHHTYTPWKITETAKLFRIALPTLTPNTNTGLEHAPSSGVPLGWTVTWIYIYVCVCVHIYTYIYIYTYSFSLSWIQPLAYPMSHVSSS